MLKIKAREPEEGGPALIDALNYLEERPEEAQRMGLAGARLAEEILSVDSVQRCSTSVRV